MVRRIQSRYGNKVFRLWFDKPRQSERALILSLLPDSWKQVAATSAPDAALLDKMVLELQG